jgi:hypothetical protein
MKIYKTPDNCFSIEEARLASYEELLEELNKTNPSLFVADQHSTGFSLACLKVRKATKREIKQAFNEHRKNS